MNIPQSAKKVFQGKFFEIFRWEQEMFDGSKELYERAIRPPSVVIIPVVGDKVLVQYEEQPEGKPFVGVASGASERGEDILVAAQRELVEETGYESDDYHKLCVTSITGKYNWSIHTYIARNCKKVAEPKLEPGERITHELICYEEFLTFIRRRDFRNEDIKHKIFEMIVEDKLDELKKLLFK